MAQPRPTALIRVRPAYGYALYRLHKTTTCSANSYKTILLVGRDCYEYTAYVKVVDLTFPYAVL
jgi:hypothetical protein